MKRGDSLLSLFVFVLIGGFAVLSLTAVLVGGRVYQSIADRSDRNAGIRTTAAYIAGKVRAYDYAGGVTVNDADGISVLELRSSHDGSSFVTYIYCLDGQVREYYQREGRDFVPENGERIAEADALSFALGEDGLTVSVSQRETDTDLFLALRAGGAK